MASEPSFGSLGVAVLVAAVRHMMAARRHVGFCTRADRRAINGDGSRATAAVSPHAAASTSALAVGVGVGVAMRYVVLRTTYYPTLRLRFAAQSSSHGIHNVNHARYFGS